MKVAMACLGTRGDVQPFIALSRALQRRGHQVTLCANRDQGALALRAEVPFVPLDVDVSAFYRREDVRDLLARSDQRGLVATGQRWLRDIAATIMPGLRAALRGQALVISGFLVDDFAAPCAEAEGARFVLSGFAPYLPSGEQASIVLAPRGTRWLRRASHRLVEQLAFAPKRALVNAWRRELGVPETDESVLRRTARLGAPYLGAWSPTLQPALASYGSTQLVTGAWRVDAEARARLFPGELARPLADWLGRGRAPVYLGFGSMPLLDPTRALAMCQQIAHADDLRFVLATSELPPHVDERIFVLPHATDHDALFPRCAAIIHHGGAGTTHTALHAGRPSWAVSMFADAPYWGARLAAASLGGHTPHRALDAEPLRAALTRLLSPELQQRARSLATVVRRECGAEVAADFLEQLDAERAA